MKSDVLRLAAMIKPRRKSYGFGLLGIGLIDSVHPLIFPLLVKFVFDAVAKHDMHSLWLISFDFLGLILLLCSLKPLCQYRFEKTVKTVMADLRLQYFGHLAKLPVSYYENTHSGDAMSRFNNDLGVVENAFNGDIRSLLSMVMTGGYSAAIMFGLDWRFAAAMVAMGLLSTYVNLLFAKPLRTISGKIQQAAGKQMEILSELITGTKVIRIFQMSERMNAKYKEAGDAMAEMTVTRAATYASQNSLNYLLIWIINSGVFIGGTLMVMHGFMTLGTLLALIILLAHVENLFRQIGALWSNLQASLAGAARVFEILEIDEEPERYPSSAAPADCDGVQSMIGLQSATFCYDENVTVLDSLTLSVERDQIIALVGPSGGGKSTIIKLLLGFYPLHRGEIRIEGRSCSEWTLSEWRNRMAYVSQDAYLFDGTIEENIRYGRMDASFDEIQAASRDANAHDFIVEQPDGYGTRVGERGARLSGGQKQRIAIARALLRNAPILLLDEATSALDSESEQAVQQGLGRLMEGKTTIAIAHRLSTIKHSDKICVIEKGKLVEEGSHETLIAMEGTYSRLHRVLNFS